MESSMSFEEIEAIKTYIEKSKEALSDAKFSLDDCRLMNVR